MLLRVLIVVACLIPAVGASAADAPKPHIIFMLADDLGWGDVGYHGSKIATPNIDALAKRGVKLEQFYAQPVCSPTRGALLSGMYPYQIGLQCGVVRPWANYGGRIQQGPKRHEPPVRVACGLDAEISNQRRQVVDVFSDRSWQRGRCR